ncbi:MAG: AmmeMemoRadiSam system radical SAM enzyme [Candidatus Omnitrophica bacterium]|nr:AmmeMemoRadiSam system radical SAM enzyme [Candidatus Omnitrophota bacterium]
MKKRLFQKTILIFVAISICIFLNILLNGKDSVNAAGKPLLGKREALYYTKIDDKTVQCGLCPRRCLLMEGMRGACRVRQAGGGRLYTYVYGNPCAYHIDPIEKKPVYHMLPATASFSIATAGCNLRCKFCQNWTISQRPPEETDNIKMMPQEVVEQALKNNCSSIAYTYSEPIIFYEYMLDTAKLARDKGLKNVMVTAGYINEEPLRQLCKYIDAANVDLKGFDKKYLREICGEELEPLLEALKIFKEEGVWLELTNLIVPTLNDDMETIEKMCIWIRDNLGAETPLHFSRFTPMYKLRNLYLTPASTLEEAREVAKRVGLKYVYIGNVPGHPAENTYCPDCRALLIERLGFSIKQNNVVEGRCKFCGRPIPGIW